MTLARLLFALSVILLAVGGWLALDNPDIQAGPPEEITYTCLAPWDIVLNDADTVPNGEHDLRWAERVGAQCEEAGHGRFELAVATGSIGLLMAGVGAVRAMTAATRPAAEPE